MYAPHKENPVLVKAAWFLNWLRKFHIYELFGDIPVWVCFVEGKHTLALMSTIDLGIEEHESVRKLWALKNNVQTCVDLLNKPKSKIKALRAPLSRWRFPYD